MFLQALLEKNRPLAELGLKWQQNGKILPDTYLLDLDTICQNAAAMKAEADKYGIRLYFMLKQIGRNPVVARALMDIGFAGAVCVDYREALTMIENHIPLGNVGHLVQVPTAAMDTIVAAHPDIMTVYTLDKVRQIVQSAQKQGFVQPIMLRVLDKGDMLYSGQYGGFWLSELEQVTDEIEKIPGVRIAGVCSFPCFLYDEAKADICPTPNLKTVQKAAEYLRGRGYQKLQLNMPSASCVHSIAMAAAAGATHMEPGHGLTGTTPYHATHSDAVEKPAYLYVSEVSHTLGDVSFCYAGGHYRRGHMKNALVGQKLEDAKLVTAVPPTDESIDYHFELEAPCKVGDSVLLCFRTQIFVTRSEVAVVKGLAEGKPECLGIWSALGQRIR